MDGSKLVGKRRPLACSGDVWVCAHAGGACGPVCVLRDPLRCAGRCPGQVGFRGTVFWGWPRALHLACQWWIRRGGPPPGTGRSECPPLGGVGPDGSGFHACQSALPPSPGMAWHGGWVLAGPGGRLWSLCWLGRRRGTVDPVGDTCACPYG